MLTVDAGRDHCETGQGFRVSPSTFKQTLEGTMQHVYTGGKIKKALLKKGFSGHYGA